MTKYERLNQLLELLATDGHVSVDEAAERLTVSPATVRRDLDALAAQQLLTRTHGGAVSNNTAYDLPLRYKSARNAAEKVRIAAAAAALVPPGAVVGMNGGTTTTEVARALATRDDLQSDSTPAVTVVTNALNIAHELTVRSQVKLVVLGGVPRAQSYELVGPLATSLIDQLSLDLAVIGVDAFDLRQGGTAHNEAEAEVNARLARQARRVLVVADSSKLGHAAFAQIMPIESVSVLITDSGAAPEFVAALRQAGVEVIQA